MTKPLRVLLVEDVEDDALLTMRELWRGGYDVTYERVDTAEAMQAALQREPWDVVLCDYTMPRFSGPAALELVQASGLDIPFILVTGTVNEEHAAAIMKTGAHDYIMKDKRMRLAAAVERELREAEMRREKRRVEEERARLIALVETTTDFVGIGDTRGQALYINRAGRQLRGIGANEDVSGANIADCIAERDQAFVLTEAIPAIIRDGAWSGEIALLSHDGREIPASAVGLAHRAPDGTVAYLSIVARDITGRKRAEEALRTSEARYRLLFDSMLDGFALHEIICDEAGQPVDYRFLEINPAFERLTGLRAADLIGKTVLEVLPGIEPVWIERYGAVALTGEPAHFAEYSRELDRHYEVTAYCPKRGQFAVIFEDITERKRAEEERARLAHRIQTILNSAGEGIYGLDAEGKATFVNPAAARLLGYTVEEQIGQPQHSLIHHTRPDGSPYPREECPIYAAFTDGAVHRVSDEVFWRKDGSSFPVEYTSTPIREDGRLAGAVVIFNDITERKRAEEALRRSEEQYRSLVTATSQIVWTTNAQGEVTEDLPTWRAYTGQSQEEIRGWGWSNALHPEDRERTAAIWSHAVETHSLYDTEYRLRRYDGEYRDFAVRGVPVLENDGSIREWVGTCTDITARKRAEEERQESKNRFHSAFEFAAIGMALVAPDGRWLRVNRALCELTGHSERELLSKTFQDITHPDDLETDLAYVRQMLAGEIHTYQMEKRYLHKLGHVVWVLLSVSLVRDSQDKPLYFVSQIQDITERKRAQEELERTAETLRRTLGATIQAMAVTVETRDAYTAGHQRRVADLARAMATEMGLPKERIEGLRMAAVIHDIGKITVPTDILNKPARLSENEFGIIKCHPKVGYGILKTIEFPWPIAQVIFQHHERMDGSGYPQGLSSEEITLEARILAVADVVEAMASHRPYRPALGTDKALEELSRRRGVLYDPEVVDICLKLFTEKGFEFEQEPVEG